MSQGVTISLSFNKLKILYLAHLEMHSIDHKTRSDANQIYIRSFVHDLLNIKLPESFVDTLYCVHLSFEKNLPGHDHPERF